jgi:serine/threonine-protein kinase
MEFLRGRELRQLMREHGRFSLDDAVFVLLQLLDALSHSHLHGVVHRDIKPSNVMVLEGLNIKVMDFGIARIESAAFTQMGTLLGTPSYMAPEQMIGEAADGRADLWAAGVMLYEMLADQSPFAAASASSFQAMQNRVAAEPTPLSSLVPGLPVAIDGLMRRALARRREERFQQAGEFARELTKAAAAAADAVDLGAGSDAVDVDLTVEPAAPPRTEDPGGPRSAAR